MIGKYSNKEMSGGQSKGPRVLVCLRECEMPGIGFWKVGDRISDETIIEKISDNPNFSVEEELTNG